MLMILPAGPKQEGHHIRFSLSDIAHRLDIILKN